MIAFIQVSRFSTKFRVFLLSSDSSMRMKMLNQSVDKI